MADEPPRYEAILEQGIRERTRAAVSSGNPTQLSALVEQATALAEGLLLSLRERDPPDAPAACDVGCAHCCHFQVAVSAPEALRIADHLRNSLPRTAVAALAERSARLAEEERGLDAAARVRLRRPCVFLEHDRCSVYTVRPLACQGANATDARVCAAALDGDDVRLSLYAHQVNVMKAAARGFNAAFDGTAAYLELTAAMAIALNDAAAASRWIAGQPVFAAARLPVQRSTNGAPM